MNNYIKHIVEDFDFNSVSNNVDADDLILEQYYKKLFEKFVFENEQMKPSDYEMFARNITEYGCKFKYKVMDEFVLQKIIGIYQHKSLEHILKYTYNLNWIDTSRITYLTNFFKGTSYSEFLNVSEWDVSNVSNMIGIFCDCNGFNCDISKWNVSKVEDAAEMFYGCEHFNQDISKWNTHRLKNMNGMFYRCIRFNQDLSNWDVTNVKYFVETFAFTKSLNKTNFEKWSMPNLEIARSAFDWTDYPMPNWYLQFVHKSK